MKKVLVVAAAGLLVFAVPACKFLSCKKAETTEQVTPAPEAPAPVATEAPVAPAAEAPAAPAEAPAEAK